VILGCTITRLRVVSGVMDGSCEERGQVVSTVPCHGHLSPGTASESVAGDRALEEGRKTGKVWGTGNAPDAAPWRSAGLAASH
jgi:hypothetical protein